MILFELKRFIKSRNLFFMLIGILLIIVTNIILQNVYDSENLVTNEQRFFNIYNSFSQFSFLVFAPILGTAISNDREKNYLQFYKQIGVSAAKYVASKIIVYLISILSISSTILVGIQFLYPIDRTTFFRLLVIINLNLTYCVCIGFLISLIVKKSLYGALGMIVAWFILSMLNIIPFPIVRGYLYLSDNNSYVSAYVSSLLGIEPHSFYFNKMINDSVNKVLFVQIVCISIVMLVVCSVIYIKRKKKEYV